ncbi:MAG TPA: cupin domain-containing protein [Anaerolineae bacterium]|nr:cupin domain-containing protein [Anaerolineae bacterium]
MKDEMFKDYRDHVGVRADKHFKTTLFQGDHVMVGLNCLEPGQTQEAHAHAAADKFYYVIEGRGAFTIGDEVREAGPGMMVWAPAGASHGVENRSETRLTLLVGIAPPPR